ncbi:MAG: 3'-5' exonuclease [Planctomycetes bacterium]|nr:3'-5' exonuclease [Planctomycetota bacterium]
MADPREFIVFDTETTGMPPGARLVEIGAIKVRGESVIDRFDSLVNPQIPIPSQVVSVHGISDEDVQDAPHAREVLLKFADWAGKLPLLGHNVAFDAAMLATESLRAGLSLPKNPTYCTLQSARRFLRRKSHSLENLVRDLDLPTAEHHRASSDALHTLHVLWRIQEVASCRAVLKKGRAVHEFAPKGWS